MATALVQSRSASGSGTSLALAFSSNNTAGNLLVAAGGAGADVTNMVDTNVTYSMDRHEENLAGTAFYVEVWHTENCAAGANTVTMSYGSSSSKMAIAEYSGLATSNALDAVNSNKAFGTAITSGNITTAGAGVLVAFVIGENIAGISVAPDASFTEREEIDLSAPPVSILEYQDRITTAGGTYSGSGTLGSATNWVMILTSYKVPPRQRLYIPERLRPAPFKPGIAR